MPTDFLCNYFKKFVRFLVTGQQLGVARNCAKSIVEITFSRTLSLTVSVPRF